MSKAHHRRGTSQQIQRGHQDSKNYMDANYNFKNNYALSSEHTRSTVLTARSKNHKNDNNK